MEIQESGEMYLETILKLGEKKPAVHSVDIVEALDYSKSSVSRAVNVLKDRGFIEIGADGELKFTERGRARAEEIYARHRVLTEFLLGMGVSPAVAEADACRIEHVISPETFEAVKKRLDG